MEMLILKFTKNEKTGNFEFDKNPFSGLFLIDYLKEVLKFEFVGYLDGEVVVLRVGNEYYKINSDYFLNGHASLTEMLGLLKTELESVQEWQKKVI